MGGGGGVRSHFWSTSQLISLHLASSPITPAGSVHKSRGDNVGAVEEMVCVAEGKSFKLTLSGCVVSICCVGFASLDVV